MKRFLLLILTLYVLIPGAKAQSKDLIEFDKEVFKKHFLEKLKKDNKTLNFNETQWELLGYKFDGIIEDYAKKNTFKLSKGEIEELRDSTKTLKNLRKVLNDQEKSLETKQNEIDRLHNQFTDLSAQNKDLKSSVSQLQEFSALAPEVEDLKSRLHETGTALSHQKAVADSLDSRVEELMGELAEKEKELGKWKGGVESILESIEVQCQSIRNSSLADMDPVSFAASVSSFQGLRSFVQAIDPERVFKIEAQIDTVHQLMSVSHAFQETKNYIQGRQERAKAKSLLEQLKTIQGTDGISESQAKELEGIVTALGNQAPLYGDLRETLKFIRDKKCLPTKEKIEEQLNTLKHLEITDDFLLNPEYHLTYLAALNKLKDCLRRAADREQPIFEIVKDYNKFPKLIDEIMDML